MTASQDSYRHATEQIQLFQANLGVVSTAVKELNIPMISSESYGWRKLYAGPPMYIKRLISGYDEQENPIYQGTETASTWEFSIERMPDGENAFFLKVVSYIANELEIMSIRDDLRIRGMQGIADYTVTANLGWGDLSHVEIKIRVGSDNPSAQVAEIMQILETSYHEVYRIDYLTPPSYEDEAGRLFGAVGEVLSEIVGELEEKGCMPLVEKLAAIKQPQIIDAYTVDYPVDEDFGPRISVSTICEYYLLRNLIKMPYINLSLEQQEFFRSRIIEISREIFIALFNLVLKGDPGGIVGDASQQVFPWEKMNLDTWQAAVQSCQIFIEDSRISHYISSDNLTGWAEIVFLCKVFAEELSKEVPLTTKLVLFLDKVVNLTHSGNEESTIPQRLVRFDPRGVLAFIIHGASGTTPMENSVLASGIEPTRLRDIQEKIGFLPVDFSALDIIRMIFQSDQSKLALALWRSIFYQEQALRTSGTNQSAVTFQPTSDWSNLIAVFTIICRHANFSSQPVTNLSLRAEYLHRLDSQILLTELSNLFPAFGNRLASRIKEQYNNMRPADPLKPDSETNQLSGFLESQDFQVVFRPIHLVINGSAIRVITIEREGVTVAIAYLARNNGDGIHIDRHFPPVVFVNGVEVSNLGELLVVTGLPRVVYQRYVHQDGD